MEQTNRKIRNKIGSERFFLEELSPPVYSSVFAVPHSRLERPQTGVPRITFSASLGLVQHPLCYITTERVWVTGIE